MAYNYYQCWRSAFLQDQDFHQVCVDIFTRSRIIAAPPDLDVISGGWYDSMEPAVALTTLVPCSSAPRPVPQRVIPGCHQTVTMKKPTLTVVVLSNKVWYMCDEVWVVNAGACLSSSFTTSSGVRPQVLARLSCSDGDAIQVGAIYADVLMM